MSIKLVAHQNCRISLIENNPGPLPLQKHIFPTNWFLFQFVFVAISIFVEFVTRFSRVFSSCWHLLWDDTIINCFECTLLNVSGLDNPLKYFPHKSQISIWNNCLCKRGYFNGFDIFQQLSVQFKPFQATKAIVTGGLIFTTN